MQTLRYSLAILSLFAVGSVSAATTPLRITVMTYNIHHAAGMDGKLDVKRIAEVIKKANPDVVALQEVDRGCKRTNDLDEASEIGKFADMQAVFGKAMKRDGGEYGDAILTRFKVKEHRVIDLPYTHEGKHEPRVALEVRCHTDAGEVVFLSTHLDQLGEPNDRLEQAKAILEATKDEKMPSVLAGDFNCGPNKPPTEAIEKTWKRATDNQPSVPVVNPKGKIDHIFVKPGSRWKVVETHVIDEEMASDHRPVIATLELLPER